MVKTEKQFIHTTEASKAQTMETWNTEGREAAQGLYIVQKTKLLYRKQYGTHEFPLLPC